MKRLISVIVILGLGAGLWWVSKNGSSIFGGDHNSSTSKKQTGEASGTNRTPDPKNDHLPVEREPKKRPGEPIEVELINAPAIRYDDADMTGADQAYAAIVDALGRNNVTYDPNLGRGAQELAYQHSLIGGLVPSQVVEFLLRSSGAVDRSVVQGYTRTSGDERKAIQGRLKGLLESVGANSPLIRIGIGEAYIPGNPPTRYIAILLSRRQIEIGSPPRRIEPGGSWVLTGVFPRGHSHPGGLVLHPSGRLETVEIATDGRRFTLRVQSEDTVGRMDVSIGADGPHGHTPLLQVPVEIGRSMPTVLKTNLLPDESHIKSPKMAEDLAFELLNADRRRFGLSLLQRDPGLDAIARAHSVDMRESDFFGHYSVNTGSAGDRLAAAGYRAASFAENVALGQSIHGAEDGLLYSLGHRRNILSQFVTHVGIGVAGRLTDGRFRWWLTQLFAKPTRRVRSKAGVLTLKKRFNEQRRQMGLKPFVIDTGLSDIARHAARLVAARGGNAVPQDMVDAAKKAGLVTGHVYAWIRAVSDLNDVALPSEVENDHYGRVGIGVVQLPDDPRGLIGVAILVTGKGG